MHHQARQQRTMIGIIGTLIVVVVGGILLAAPLLYWADPRPALSQAHIALPRSPQVTAKDTARPTPPPLPTVFVPASIAPLPELSDVRAPSSDMQGEDDRSATNLSATQHDDLTARLANDLTCLQRGAQHVPELDERATALAKEETTPLPQAGVIQLEDQESQRILLGSDMVAGLRTAHARCGETLIFGVPPLEWLPQGARFGIGVSERPEGLVIVVIKGS